MPIGPLLLRVLLCLCLVLNGVASAAASAQMPTSMHATAATPQPAIATASDDMPCHGHHDAMASMAKQHAPASEGPAPSKPKHSPDCCKSGACRCACVHIAQVGVPALQIPAVALDHARSVRTLALGHPAPALPHPIRPPIG
jgi:hypothetical protein